jgi:diacylglycerol kinase
MFFKTILSFVYSFKGIVLVFRNESNSKIHLIATVLVIGAGIYYRLEQYDWLWILLAIAVVWIMEAINSAIEKLTDFISTEFNPKAGAIKDMAAGAVLLAAVFAIAVGLIIFIPYLGD